MKATQKHQTLRHLLPGEILTVEIGVRHMPQRGALIRVHPIHLSREPLPTEAFDHRRPDKELVWYREGPSHFQVDY